MLVIFIRTVVKCKGGNRGLFALPYKCLLHNDKATMTIMACSYCVTIELQIDIALDSDYAISSSLITSQGGRMSRAPPSRFGESKHCGFES